MPIPAIIAASAIGAAGSLASGVMGASAAKKAAKAQTEAADKAAALQRDSAVQARIDAYPWAMQGAQAMYQYMDELGISRPETMILPDLTQGPFNANGNTQSQIPASAPANASANPAQGQGNHLQSFGKQRGLGGVSDARVQTTANTLASPFQSPSQMKFTARKGFQETPGYQFQIQQGEQGVRNNLAALGMKNSGSALKALTRFRSGLADQEYGNYLNRLAGVAGMGQSQVNSTNALTTNAANNIGQNYQNAGEARASGYVGAANSWNNALSSISNNVGGALGAYKPKPGNRWIS